MFHVATSAVSEDRFTHSAHEYFHCPSVVHCCQDWHSSGQAPLALSPLCLSFLRISLCLFFFLVHFLVNLITRPTSKQRTPLCFPCCVDIFIPHSKLRTCTSTPMNRTCQFRQFETNGAYAYMHTIRACVFFNPLRLRPNLDCVCVCVRWGKQKGLEGGRTQPSSAFHSFRGALLPSWLTLRHPSHRSSGLLIYRSSNFLEFAWSSKSLDCPLHCALMSFVCTWTLSDFKCLTFACYSYVSISV